MELTAALAVLVSVSVMISAAIFDWKYREIPDIHWWVMGIAGIAIHLFSDGLRWENAMLAIGMFAVLYDILREREFSGAVSFVYHTVMAVMFAVPIASLYGSSDFIGAVSIPVCIGLFFLMYQTGILRGGADAKCMIVMCMMFPSYPDIATVIPMPMSAIQAVVPFSVALMFHASLFSFAWLIWIIIVKIARRQAFGLGTFAYLRMDIACARKSFVWSKQDVVDGKVVMIKGEAEEGVYEWLEAAGQRSVWVTPIIPFMIPILAALVFMLTVGNLLFAAFI